MATVKKKQMKADWGVKILKDIKRAAPSYQRTGYIGNGVILTRIVYEALGIRNKIQWMPPDEELLEAIESQRGETHKQVKRKAQEIVSSTSEEEESHKEDTEESKNEESEEQEQAQKTIQVGQKQIPIGSTPGPEEPKRKLRVKLATKRPAREEELAQIKEEIAAKQPQKRVCIREVEQTTDSYLKLVKLHKEGKKVVAEEAEEEEEEEGLPLRKELRTKRRRDPAFLKTTHSEPTMGTSHLVISSPTSPHTHHSLPLPIINDPLDEVIPLNLNLNDHFDLDIPHISPTLERTNDIILQPTEKMIEPAQTPSLTPIITLPTHETTQQETPTTEKIQAQGSSINQEGLLFEELKWALEIDDNVQKMLSHYKTQRNQIKAQHEEYKNWLSVKTKLEEKIKEQDG